MTLAWYREQDVPKTTAVKKGTDAWICIGPTLALLCGSCACDFMHEIVYASELFIGESWSKPVGAEKQFRILCLVQETLQTISSTILENTHTDI